MSRQDLLERVRRKRILLHNSRVWECVKVDSIASARRNVADRNAADVDAN